MKQTIAGLFGFFLVGGILVLWSMQNTPETVEESSIPRVDLMLEGVTLRQGRDGRLVWTLNATRADYRKEEGFVIVTDPEMVCFQEDDKEPVYMHGDHGRIDQKNDQADIWSHVEVRYQEGRLTTANLHYNGTNSLLCSQDGITLRGWGMFMTAEGGCVDLTTRHAEVHGGVKAVLHISQKP